MRRLSSTMVISVLSLAMFDIPSVRAASETLEKIKELGKITFGYREASIPFAYLGPDQKPAGLSVDLCSEVADRILSLIHI